MSAQPQTVLAAMGALRHRTHGAAPDCYLASAEWWLLQAKLSGDPGTCREYARNLVGLADDMAARPRHYVAKPAGLSNWEWSRA